MYETRLALHTTFSLKFEYLTCQPRAWQSDLSHKLCSIFEINPLLRFWHSLCSLSLSLHDSCPALFKEASMDYSSGPCIGTSWLPSLPTRHGYSTKVPESNMLIWRPARTLPTSATTFLLLQSGLNSCLLLSTHLWSVHTSHDDFIRVQCLWCCI